MKLRDYQAQLITAIYRAWDDGHQNVGAQLATGGGKTVIFGEILRAHRGWSIAIAHRVELVSQISLTLARQGIYHEIIIPPAKRRDIIQLQLRELGHSYVHPRASCRIASVDTLVRMDGHTPWFQDVTLLVQDEGHHVLYDNKWGRAAALFPNARGLYPTATPIRADGQGLGRHHDGIIDTLVQGPPMRELIDAGHLTDYRIFAPPSNLDLSPVNVTASGEYSMVKLRDAVNESTITGDVVSHYLRHAEGKLGVTFAVDIEAAHRITSSFRAEGVNAEMISSKTPAPLRAEIMRRFRARKLDQVVNVDILGEGVDVPAIEVVSFARPTQSFSLYSQQFGRALRPLPGKDRAIIIDHVGNVARHGVPDAARVWSLDRREKRAKATISAVPVRTCSDCFGVYERREVVCPYCGKRVEPVSRGEPKFVDGDLTELGEDALARLRGDIDEVDGAPKVPMGIPHVAKLSIIKRHNARKQAQDPLREKIALYAGYLKRQGKEDYYIYRDFYLRFGVDILTAQTLKPMDAKKLQDDIQLIIDLLHK